LNIYMYISNELHTFCFLLYFIQEVYSIVISLIVKKINIYSTCVLLFIKE